MTEHRFFNEGETAYVSTFDYHKDRERAPHLEQSNHRGRLERAAEFVLSVGIDQRMTVSDLGCGDGGLLRLLTTRYELANLPNFCWGYDFAPANVVGWKERGVEGTAMNVFDTFDIINPEVQVGDIVVMTEVLEHLAHPHKALRDLLTQGVEWLVCSSPWNERPGMHSPEHAWAWDIDGYPRMVTEAGWTVVRHETAGLFQVVLAKAS